MRNAKATLNEMIESLEHRKLFAAAPITLGPNTLFFNAVVSTNSSSTNGGPHTSTYALRVQNTGTKRLLVSDILVRGTDQTDFTVDDFPSTGVSMAPGKMLNFNITFHADSTPGIKTGFLVVKSGAGQSRIPLRALVTKGEGTTFEPSLQDIFDLYDFKINAGEQSGRSDPYFVASGTSDQVDITTLVKADPNADVILRPLAEFTNHATPAVRMGFYTPGQLDSEKYLWYSPSASSQSVTPLVYGQTKFNPGNGPFGLVTQYPFFTNPDGTTTNVYSENALNRKLYLPSATSTPLVHMKFYPYKDAQGTAIPNTYIVAEEEFGSPGVSDSQDLVFIVTNVKPANTQPTIAVQNLTGFPSNEIATFNVIQNLDQFVPNVVKNKNTIRILNSGTAPLTFSAAVSGSSDYTLSATGGTTNVTLAPGASKDIVVTFTATSGTAVHTGQLVITSNDSKNPTTSVTLLGNWQQFSEQNGPGQPSVEPSAQKLVNQLLGYQTTILNPGQRFDTSAGTGSRRIYVGQEITAEYFQTADTDAPVNVTQLATFHNQTFTDSNNMQQATTSFIGWYKQGQPTNINATRSVFSDNPGQGQMVLGPGKNQNGTVAHGKFKVAGTQVFGVVVEHQNDTDKVGEYSDHTLNIEPAGDSPAAMAKFGGLFLRFFPVLDAHGVRVPNALIMLHDYNKSTTNYDFQDNVYLLTNIMPAGAVKTPRTAYGQKISGGNLINFTSPDDGPRVNGFNVYRSTSPTGGFTLLNGTPLARQPSQSFIDSTALANTTYYYGVTSVGSSGESEKLIIKV